MNKQLAEQAVNEYIKPIFGFALKRCRSVQDAEDLSQEIMLKVYRALLKSDGIEDTGRFIWRIAHNTLANYYRDSSRQYVGVSADELAEMLSDNERDILDSITDNETEQRLHSEIAYLSKLQREIVIAYYYNNKKQAEIADMLGIPLGTVKWHLFEAKKELKRGINMVRQNSELKFNPIRFARIGTNGSIGEKGGNHNFFRGALSQNIVYAAWKEPKTVNEIADMLGVSPVYVEGEAAYLEEYGFLLKQGDKYLCNIMLEEPSEKIIDMHNKMYTEAAEIFVNELYDELMKSDIWDNGKILGGVTEPPALTEIPQQDKNYMLWTLVPYIAALSGGTLVEEKVTFEDAATCRPDGAKNICYATVPAPDVKKEKYHDSMAQWCGPCWNQMGNLIAWSIDSEWSENRLNENYQDTAIRVISLLQRMIDGGELSEEEYSFLSEKGWVTVTNDGGHTKAAFSCLYIPDADFRKELIAIGDRIKEKHRARLAELRDEYAKAVLAETPKQLMKMQQYSLQNIFLCDGWFCLYCVMALLANGKLTPPTETQKRSMTMLLATDK